jgi:hypothetical protein
MSTMTLLPCPWCGCELSSVSVSEGSTFRWRKVDGCCTDGPEVRHDTMADDQAAAEADSEERAIEAWNNRAHLAQPALAVDVVAWRWRDNVRPGLPWDVTDDEDVINGMRRTGGYEIEPLTRAISGEKAGPVGGWQPIETAPKDGSAILIADIQDGVVYDVLNGHFEVLAEDEDDGPWDIRDGEPWCSYEGRGAGIYFCHWLPGKEWESRWLFGHDSGYTHWMPLPASPAPDKEGL